MEKTLEEKYQELAKRVAALEVLIQVPPRVINNYVTYDNKKD